jgi:hypothetical protein
MRVAYKIEGENVHRSVFQNTVNDPLVLDIWEKVIEEHRNEIEERNAAIIFKIRDNEMRVLTETYLLVKLSSAVKKQMLLCPVQ